ncbi:MAG: SCP2 sterol-binding domain-containing protein, partial [Acidimicrobiia bacterium]|nr:SCP2 sterol-binding domain-containing protein [Acidimicrobiia bacterium]
IAAHIDAADGRADIELGHLDSPEVTITTDHATARAIFADNDGSVAMAAFLGGKIRVEGDVAKLMVLMAQAQQRQAEPLAVELAQRVRAITADAT